MVESYRIVLFARLVLLLFWCEISKGYIDVTRSTHGDIFTSPRWSQADNKQGCAGRSHYEACALYGSQRTGAFCYSNEDCCKHCQCSQTAPNYLTSRRRCVSNGNLTSYLFQDRDKGCTLRIVPNDFRDNRRRSSVTCQFTHLSLPVLNTQASGRRRIDVCGIFTWSVSHCTVLTGAYHSDDGRWVDTWDAGLNQNVFELTIENRGISIMYLKWNGSLPTRYNGYIMSLDVNCKRKFGLSPFQSCLLFKTNGTHMEARPSTPPPTNSSIGSTDSKVDQGGSSNLTLIIAVSLSCVILILIIMTLVFVWFMRRARLDSLKLHQKRDSAEPRNNKRDTPIYHCPNGDTTGNPIYTKPTESSCYQDLLPNKETTGYEQLTKRREDRSGPLSVRLTPTFPDEEEVDAPHDYQVLEGP